jgi:hypothetical protein
METLDAIEVHHEYKAWLNRLAFYRDELKIMKNRLEEVTAKNTGQSILAMVEHFQNQVIVQNNNIDELRHEIKQYENRLELKMKDNFIHTEHEKDPDYLKTKGEVLNFERVFDELRKETIHFFAQIL